MKAVLQRRYGTPADLEVGRIERPVPHDREVLVRVRAASVNFADWAFVTGEPYLARLAFGLRAPRNAIPGRDVAGTVEAVGAKVARWRPGDEVYGEADGGTFAEYVAVPEQLLAPKPPSSTFVQAAAVPLAGNTAIQGLRDVGRVQPGQSVLVNGASGGVGTFAVQIAKALGAEVTGVCSTRNVDLIRSLGADRVVDYTRDDFVADGVRYDLILDSASSRTLAEYRRALTPGGTLVLSGGRGSRLFGPLGRILRALSLSPFVSQRLVVLAATRSAERLEALTAMIEAGQVTPAIERVYPLDEAPEELRRFGEEGARSKIVIEVGGETTIP